MSINSSEEKIPLQIKHTTREREISTIWKQQKKINVE